MQPFRIHKGKIAVLDRPNIDTDQIIPGRFLSRIERTGYGELLFADVRGEGFPLDAPEAQGASILVTGENFGCGSSREHAVWALMQAGFRAVIARRTERAPGFSDIFRQNAISNGLLLIELPEEEHKKITLLESGAEISIDLPSQTIMLGSESIPFSIDAPAKHALLEGLDLIGSTLRFEKAIAEYEAERGPWVPPRD